MRHLFLTVLERLGNPRSRGKEIQCQVRTVSSFIEGHLLTVFLPGGKRAREVSEVSFLSALIIFLRTLPL